MVKGRYGVAPVVLAALLVAACGEQNRYAAPPPPKVTVAHPLRQPVTQYLEVTGNTAPINNVDLVARVQGFLEEIHYKDGDAVKKGTVLFTIEPEPYQVKLDQAKAAEDGASPFTYYSPLIDNMKADPRHARDMTQMGWRR
jgi:multidrug efflux pump subunit AcrA (membrane-fusion protein)